MNDQQTTYYNELRAHRARERNQRGEAAMSAVIAGMLTWLRTILTSNSRRTLDAEGAATIERLFVDGATVFLGTVYGTVQEQVGRTAKGAGAAHRQAFHAAFPDADIDIPLASTSPRDAVRAFQERARQGYKSLNAATRRRATQQINSLLSHALSEGVTYNEATRRVAAVMAYNDPALMQAIQQSGPSGARIRAALLRGKLPDEIARGEANRFLWKARRIVLTEINTAYHNTYRDSLIGDSTVQAVQWNLSAAHPLIDVCDPLAAEDAYNLGAGVYYPNAVPYLPHPHCMCFLTAILARPSQWEREQPRASAPGRALDRPAVERLQQEREALTENAAGRLIDDYNRALAAPFK